MTFDGGNFGNNKETEWVFLGGGGILQFKGAEGTKKAAVEATTFT